MIEKNIKDHKNINYNTLMFNKLAKIYNKKYGVMTYSGTLAILSILEYEKFEDYVVVPNNTCFRVLLPIIKNKNKVIIIEPQENGFFVTSDEYINAINKMKRENTKISAIIIPYIDGVIIDLKKIRAGFDGIIIEDIAMISESRNIGKYSDYIITSYGSYKAIELGYGGAIFTNKVNLENIFDFENYNENDFVLPYALPKRLKISLENEIRKSEKEKSRNIKIAEILSTISNKHISKESDFIDNKISDNYWSKYNLRVEKEVEKKVISSLKKNCIIYKLVENIEELTDLDVVKKYNNKIIVGTKKNQGKNIIIRTNENRIRNIKTFVKSINEMEI